MIHQRTAIRRALVQLLAAGGTLAGPRVIDNPYQTRTTFPALLVLDGDEQQQPLGELSELGGTGRPIDRLQVLEVVAEVQQSTDPAGTRDSLLAQVEALLAGAAGTVPGVVSITPAGFRPDFSAEGEKPIARGMQRFVIRHLTPQDRPDLNA